MSRRIPLVVAGVTVFILIAVWVLAFSPALGVRTVTVAGTRSLTVAVRLGENLQNEALGTNNAVGDRVYRVRLYVLVSSSVKRKSQYSAPSMMVCVRVSFMRSS